MEVFDNGVISFGMIPNWGAEEDENGAILCYDPSDAEVWVSIQLAGLQADEGKPIDPVQFFAEAYPDELGSGAAELDKLPNGDHLLTWSGQADNQGTPYALHYFHVGHSPAPDTLQLALFTLTIPEARANTEYAEELLAATLQMIVNIEFFHWSRE